MKNASQLKTPSREKVGACRTRPGYCQKTRFALITPNGIQFINRPQIADTWKHNYLVSFTRTESWSDQNRLTLKTGIFILQSLVRVHNGVEINSSI